MLVLLLRGLLITLVWFIVFSYYLVLCYSVVYFVLPLVFVLLGFDLVFNFWFVACLCLSLYAVWLIVLVLYAWF